MTLSRRAFLQTGALAGPWLVSRPLRAWGESVPRSVRDHGARGNGKANDTAAIQRAIDAAPGGVVLFPPGDYVSGTLHLRDRLVLRLAAGATLVASRDNGDFDPPEKLDYNSFADRETTDFSFALLQGRRLQHVSIVGPGRIDGNRRSRGGPKPIALKQCRDVTIRDVTLENAPNYNISMLAAIASTSGVSPSGMPTPTASTRIAADTSGSPAAAWNPGTTRSCSRAAWRSECDGRRSTS